MARICIRPKTERRTPTYRRAWGCPLTKNRTPWCFRICTPSGGLGPCGRIAPQTLLGRTQAAILNYGSQQGAGEPFDL